MLIRSLQAQVGTLLYVKVGAGHLNQSEIDGPYLKILNFSYYEECLDGSYKD